VLRRFLAADGGLAAGLAWLRGAREWCAVVNASALRAEERGDEGAEADDESRMEWVGVRWPSREEERTTSLSDRQRNEVTHGAAAACIAYGGHAVAGRQRWHEVAVAAVQLPCATPASGRRLSSA
jgi:hypothetical protein